MEESSHTLSYRFRNCVDDFYWIFRGIYGPTKREARLGDIRVMWGDPWCIGDDFNVLRFPRERNREGRWTGALRRFSQIIDELELKDLPLQGGVFTWTGGPGNQIMARLDIFLITDD